MTPSSDRKSKINRKNMCREQREWLWGSERKIWKFGIGLKNLRRAMEIAREQLIAYHCRVCCVICDTRNVWSVECHRRWWIWQCGGTHLWIIYLRHETRSTLLAVCFLCWLFGEMFKLNCLSDDVAGWWDDNWKHETLTACWRTFLSCVTSDDSPPLVFD